MHNVYKQCGNVSNLLLIIHQIHTIGNINWTSSSTLKEISKTVKSKNHNYFEIIIWKCWPLWQNFSPNVQSLFGSFKTNTFSENASLIETGALSGILSPGYFFLRSAISGFNVASKAASSSFSSFFFSKKCNEKNAVHWSPIYQIISKSKQCWHKTFW